MTQIAVSEVDWLRNDYVKPITVGGITYNTVEHAFQAAKFTDVNIKQQIAAADLREARRIGRRNTPRSDWESVRVSIMKSLVRQKFSDDTLGQRLIGTNDDPIVMEGYDNFWGTGDDGDGDNTFGGILEEIRAELQDISGYDAGAGVVSDVKAEAPSLYEAILHNPDEDLATACQDLYESVRLVLKYVDKNDFDADFIASKTGAPRDLIGKAIDAVKEAQTSVSHIESLLTSTDDDDDSVEDEDDDEDCGECDGSCCHDDDEEEDDEYFD